MTRLDLTLTPGANGTYASIGWGDARFSFGPLDPAHLAALSTGFGKSSEVATTTYGVGIAASGVAVDDPE